MRTATVNISFRKDLLDQIDSVARKEARSRSELIREAARHYIETARSWESLLSQGRKLAKASKIQESDVAAEIKAHRMKSGKKP